MGTDVHAIFQKRTDQGWQPVESQWDQDRHYFLFSWLADVRNGYGVAGIPTYSPITPIAPPRGLPPDFSLKDVPRDAFDDVEEDDGEGWIGDHSFSWLTADEILAAKVPDRVWRTGVVTREVFDAWDGHSQPLDWCGGIVGGGTKVAPSPTDVEPDSTHVCVWWIAPADQLKYFVDEIARLKAEHGNVRMVFGFDS